MGEANFYYFTCLESFTILATAQTFAAIMTAMETTPVETATTTTTSTATTTDPVQRTMEKIANLKRLARASRASRTSSRKSGGSTSADSGDEGSFISNGSRLEDFLEPTEISHVWGCELSRKSSSHVLPFPADTDPDNEHHTLVFKSAALGVEVEDKGRNVVEIHYQDRDEKEQRHVLCSLTLGASEFCRLDLRTTLVSGREITLKLIKGSGPVCILGNHIVESFVDTADAVAVDTEDEDASSADESFKPAGDSTADLETSEASGMETEGDEVDADEVKDITEDAKEVGEPTSKGRKTKE